MNSFVMSLTAKKTRYIWTAADPAKRGKTPRCREENNVVKTFIVVVNENTSTS